MYTIDTYTAAANWHQRDGIPNQDAFAVCQTERDLTIVIADGCSSLPDSHLIAWWLTNACVKATTKDLDTIIYKTCDDYKKWRFHNELAHSTLVWANINSKLATIRIYGDGGWGYKTKDGTIAVHNIDYDNMPRYPTYPENMQQDWVTKPKIMELNSTAKWRDERTYIEWELPMENIDMLWIASDGIFGMGTISEVNEQVTALKSKNGTFLKRRLTKWLKNQILVDDTTLIGVVQNEQESYCLG